MMWLSVMMFLFFGMLSVTCIVEGDINPGSVFGIIALLCGSPLAFWWHGFIDEKDKAKFIQIGKQYEKCWLVRRRAFRVVALAALLSAATAWVVVGLHDDVRKSLYRNAVDEYERKLERNEIALEEYQEALQQYYIDARLAMGLDEEGWVTANVATSREALKKWGNIGNTLRFDCYVNGQSVRYGGRARVRIFADNELESELMEIDPSENDVGTKTSQLYISPQQFNNGISFSHQVTVSESRGRYAGSYFTMLVTYTIQAETPLDINALSNLERPERPDIDPAIEPKFESIPDNYVYTFSHNLFGQIILVLFGAALVWYYVRAWKKDEILLGKRTKEAEEEAEREHQRLLKEKEEEIARQEKQKRSQDEREARKEELKKLLEEHTVEELAGVPKGVKFDENDLPYDDWRGQKYGHFTVFATRAGRRYHATRGCCGAYIEDHIFTAFYINLTPCQICAKRYPYKMPEWYNKYKKLKVEIKEYGL